MMWDNLNWELIEALSIVIGALVVFLWLRAMQERTTGTQDAHFAISHAREMEEDAERLRVEQKEAFDSIQEYYDYKERIETPPV